MLALGESGRYEFKSAVNSVTSSLFATLANWVALDPEREVAHLLVGVNERTDEATGLVYGEPCGLPRGLDRAVERIQNVASETRPIPVDIFVIEEAVAEDIPFVRVEVRPTMPPHFDGEGRRQTRIGRSTRPLTDDELLRIYLDREAGSFAARFRQTSAELRAAVGTVGTQVDLIAGAIEQNIAEPIRKLTSVVEKAGAAASSAAEAATEAEDAASLAASSASSAESTADSVGYDVQRVERFLRDLHDLVEEIGDNSPQSLAARVADQRRIVWWNFTVDTWERHSERAERLASDLNELLTADIPLDDARNTWELRVWQEQLADRLAQRGEKGTLKWWQACVNTVDAYLDAPGYETPELPDLRAELWADFDKALEDDSSATNRFRRLLET
jgi:hypothetical protein